MSRLTEKDLLEGGWFPQRSFVSLSEADAAAVTARAQTAGERQDTARQKKLLEKKQTQINLFTSIRPEIRADLKNLSQKIIDDEIRAAVTAVSEDGSRLLHVVLDALSDGEIMKAVQVASEAPYIVKLGIRASRDDVRPSVEAVIASDELRRLIEACSHNDETYESVVAILRHPSALQLLAAIAGNPDLRASMDYAITLPEAAEVGHRIIMAPGLRGRVLRKLVEWVTGPTNRRRKS
jgi:hypothetical protein